MKRYGTLCAVAGHDLEHVTADGVERVRCGRGDCDLDVIKPAGQRCLYTAYRTWSGRQGLLEGAMRG